MSESDKYPNAGHCFDSVTYERLERMILNLYNSGVLDEESKKRIFSIADLLDIDKKKFVN